jgi:hypothetical protein
LHAPGEAAELVAEIHQIGRGHANYGLVLRFLEFLNGDRLNVDAHETELTIINLTTVCSFPKTQNQHIRAKSS